MLCSLVAVVGAADSVEGNKPESVKSTFPSSTLLWFRGNLTREAADAYWRGPHAQIVGRTPGFLEYRQHYFYLENRGLWPEISGVETTISADLNLSS